MWLKNSPFDVMPVRKGRTPLKAHPNDFEFGFSHGKGKEGESFNDSSQEDPF